MADEKRGEGLFAGLGHLIGQLENLVTNAETFSKTSEGQLKSASGLEGVFGVTVRTGIGGTRVERFGNIRANPKSPSGATSETVREPITDVIEEDTGWLLIAELPGADANSVRVQRDGSVLTLEASGPNRQYRKVLDIPAGLTERGRRFENGIFELRFLDAEREPRET